jgi:hypothetical protein
MTYTAFCMDGEETMVLHFEDRPKFDKWAKSMTMVKEQAARIIAVAPDPKNLCLLDREDIRNWLHHVNFMVNAGTPMLPSILKARINFAETIKNAHSFNI